MTNELLDVLNKVADQAYAVIDKQMEATKGKMPSQESIDEAFRTILCSLTHAELVEITFFILMAPEAANVIDEMIVNKGIGKAGKETCILQQ